LKVISPYDALNRAARYISILTGLAVAVLLPVYTDEHPTVILRMVRNLGAPWPFWSVMFALYSFALIPLRTRAVGYLVGFVLYGFFGVALLFSFTASAPFPVIGGAAIVDVAVFHIVAARSAMTRRDF
jgi:hypothetical protein